MGVVAFDGLRLLTAPGRVMTPRPSTIGLVIAAATYAEQTPWPVRVADVGTGSGAIAIALARRRPNVVVVAIDTCPVACLVAGANVHNHGLERRVHVRRGDLLDDVDGQFHLIVANLPYLGEDTATDHPELAGEPFPAVFASGDGLEPYRRLVDSASERLDRSGLLLLQMDGQVVAARRAELRRLRKSLETRCFSAAPAA
jgi:release factor glutamine methyltransferase